MKRKIIGLLTASLLLGSIFTGCSGSNSRAKASDGKPVEITFWHSMSGKNGEAITKMVNDFNSSHKDIKVKAQFQGKYDEAINKLKSAQKVKQGPDVMQLYDIGTRFMIDSGWVVPVQNFIDEEKYDVSDLEPNIASYYTVNKKLYSMPFNSSTPIMYYNKDAFKAAGLDPEKPPKTFAELEQAAAKLTKKDASGNTTQYGYSMAVYGWFFEQFITKQGENYANNDNGRSAAPTAVEFDKNGTGLKVLNEWKKLVASGNAGNFGRDTDNTKNAFIAGKTAMYVDSTAVLASTLSGVGNKFEVGTAYFPSFDGVKDGGVSIGGASLWAIDSKDKDRQKATWEFMKFMASSKEQAYWSSQTGYFSVTTKAYDEQVMKDNLAKKPQFQTAIDQLHASPATANGALMSVFPEARKTIESNIEEMLQNKKSPEDTLKSSADTINAAIKKYNEDNKK
ncbi:sn-glycerol-3-phosphate-binding periplasmic protein UgpB [Clostridium pasteurianum DSM 525 = ATCC 6013]|uniref:sn-glycerol-3-phosphate-binding periplasmic protein UgpB n=1 Tax=Clostridium pasteurianum DSM 525 = ATCC 6013 TaxID=1262449 RepID=A0A0H3J416_CLOPA|nr:ABC transporter substrate-binding protein [Clostridium pasteurianum]AJA46648.1 sn-glycerol-3-phosphate-binding periplasmic protein UgpB [Clostridium pasteurianum DSM 525 = ATCC 6013]AJA50636.1 sn-glycerol-3-phosphate-binding periplasmic protein UgpB [Clostridium pasteurianum DSM 525 = ATCC 6013]AOZ74058.1 ABC transporter substrate-binding protein [Clostridium pasteurianum DSM 525 = ATCC 6013]AOZ77855.1 ABC transporter substrate-binding protein [Clostridium pasteurianum]ELP61213.1 glycerol-3